MLISRALLLAAGVALAAPGIAQDTAVAPAPPEKTVEGATPGRVQQVERCQGRKFEAIVEIDPLTKRSTRIKLCADPGATDADWTKTLEAAVRQIEQRDMPPAARDKLIAELRTEISRYVQAPKVATIGQDAPVFLTKDPGPANSMIVPTERYETSTLPPLPDRKVAASNITKSVAVQAARAMTIRLKCLERGERGAGRTCDFFDRNTVLAISAVQGLDDGGMLRFRRRGEAQGETTLAPMTAGQSARVRLPAELCRGISYSKVEIELLAPKSTGAVSARFGPYGLRC